MGRARQPDRGLALDEEVVREALDLALDLHVRRRDHAVGAQRRPVLPPLDEHVLVEAELSVLVVQLLSVLAHPGLEGPLGDRERRVGEAVEPLRGARQARGQLGELVPRGHVVLDAQLIEHELVDEHALAVEVRGDAVDLAVHGPVAEPVLAQAVRVDLLAEVRAEVEQCTRGRVAAEVRVGEPEDVGQVARRGRGRQALEVRPLVGELDGRRHALLALDEGVEHLLVDVGTVGAAPEREGQVDLLRTLGRRLGRAAAAAAGGDEGDGEHAGTDGGEGATLRFHGWVLSGWDGTGSRRIT